VKDHLLAELAAARSEIGRSSQSIGNRIQRAADIPKRVSSSVRSRPGLWISCASFLGFLASRRLFFSRPSQSVAPAAPAARKRRPLWRKIPRLAFSLAMLASKATLLPIARHYLQKRLLPASAHGNRNLQNL